MSIKEKESLMEEYQRRYVKNRDWEHDKHILNLDTLIRECIGKTDDINIPLCSHNAIINRELGEGFCRVCHKDLRIVGKVRYNDYLVLRHPQCQQPICMDCAKNNPDEFHKAFKAGIKTYKEVSPDIKLHYLG